MNNSNNPMNTNQNFMNNPNNNMSNNSNNLNNNMNFDNMFHNPVLNMGQKYMENKLIENKNYYLPFLTNFFNNLIYYFDVNNSYVKNKLKILLFPFRKSNWSRELSESVNDNIYNNNEKNKYASPWADENAPDLYIPLMSFITFVLISGFMKGTVGAFTPDVLIDITTLCFIVQIIEIIGIRMSLYFLQPKAIGIAWLDLLSYTGYKYCSLCVNLIISIIFGSIGYYLSLLWTGSSCSYFMLKTIAQAAPSSGNNSLRPIFILGIAGLQFLLIIFMGA